MDQQALAAKHFGGHATGYLTSAVHASGLDLERLSATARRPSISDALDLGCGAGHASYALARAGVMRVVAYDLAQPMLDVVAAEALNRGHAQIQTSAGAAERLPFSADSFDMVVTRFSAHHWLDVDGALAECGRVLRPGGTLIVIDVLAPERPLLDTALQTVELLRDASHVRNYRESEWRSRLACTRFSVDAFDHWKLPMEFASWVARIGTPAARIAALEVVLDALSAEARDYFQIGADRSFAIDAGWFEATKC
jgi:SAM-dependent methyltransferase